MVGIFWIYDGSLPFVWRAPIAEGDKHGDLDIIDCPKEHAEYWGELRKQGKLNVLPEELRDEYFSIPRGRVVYNCNNDKSIVYTREIPDMDLQAKIIEALELEPSKTVFSTDEHYAEFSDEDWDSWRY